MLRDFIRQGLEINISLTIAKIAKWYRTFRTQFSIRNSTV